MHSSHSNYYKHQVENAAEARKLLSFGKINEAWEVVKNDIPHGKEARWFEIAKENMVELQKERAVRELYSPKWAA